MSLTVIILSSDVHLSEYEIGVMDEVRNSKPSPLTAATLD
jgi:hypothetical protein